MCSFGAASLFSLIALCPAIAQADATLFGIGRTAFSSEAYPIAIDPSSGAFTRLGNATLPGGTYAPVYDPAQNAFYVTSRPINGATISSEFLRIDGTTGAATTVALQNNPQIPTFIEGLAFNSATSSLFGIGRTTFSSEAFPIAIDPSSGAFTRLGNATLPVGAYAPVYDPSQNAFYVTSQPLNDTTVSSEFLRIDGTTGAATTVALQNNPQIPTFIEGLAVYVSQDQPTRVPEPSAGLLLITAMTGLVYASRRRRASMDKTL